MQSVRWASGPIKGFRDGHARDTRRPGRCRVIEGGIGPDYFARRIDDFERLLDAVAAGEATSIYWV